MVERTGHAARPEIRSGMADVAEAARRAGEAADENASEVRSLKRRAAALEGDVGNLLEAARCCEELFSVLRDIVVSEAESRARWEATLSFAIMAAFSVMASVGAGPFQSLFSLVMAALLAGAGVSRLIDARRLRRELDGSRDGPGDGNMPS